MFSKRNLNLYHFSYLLPGLFAAAIGLCLLLLIGGCESRPGNSELGSIAGVAKLVEPDPATGNAGILIFLAGTPYQARTDQQGRYFMEGIPGGMYDLIAEKAGFQGQIIEGLMVNPAVHDSSAPLQPADVQLARDHVAEAAPAALSHGTITGQVLLEGMPDENGGVRVEVDGTPFVTVSSSDGTYQILNVEPGNYTLSFHRDGYLPFKTEPTDVTTGTTVMQDVALQLVQPGDPVSAGTVAQAVAARAVAPSQAELEPPPGPDDPRTIVGVVEARNAAGQVINDYSNITVAINGTNSIAEINEQGQFRFDNLTSGTYTLIGSIPDGPVVQVPVDLINQRTASVSMRLVQGEGGGIGGTVTGRVVLVDPDDVPLENASGVEVAVNGTQLSATTAADGSFTITGIPEGTYIVSATRDAFLPGEVADVAVSAAAPIDIGEIRLMMDVERPRVVSTEPEDNARDVTVGWDLPIGVKFSTRMDPASVRDAISLSPSTPFTAAIGQGAGAGATDDTLVIVLSNDNPEAPIQFGAQYRVTIADTAASMEGVTMAEPYEFSFRTANPGVIDVSPEDGANRVYVDQLENPVIFTFNTRLDPETINSRNIRVRPDRGVSVSTTHTNSDVTGWTTVRVATQWQPDTAYTVTVSRRVKAYNGQSLGNTPFTLRFRTAPIEILTMPILEKR